MAREIRLTNSSKKMIVDDDFNDLGKRYFLHKGYPHTSINGQVKKVHQILMPNPPIGKTVDHRDRDKLNNQLNNLKYATRKEQRANQKEYTYFKDHQGVGEYHKGGWRAYVTVEGRHFHLGYFPTEALAVKALEEYKLRQCQKES